MWPVMEGSLGLGDCDIDVLGVLPDESAIGQTRAMRLLIADDHPLVRKALSEAVQIACPGMVVEEVETLAQLMTRLRGPIPVGLVLLDLHLTDSHGFSGLRTIRDRFPSVPVAIISALEDPLTITGAIDLGAMGFIPKSARLPELIEAIAAIYAGEIWTPTNGSALPCASERLQEAGLTPAQQRIITALQRGLLNKQIAFELGVTEHTVKAHMTAAFRKLGVTNRMQAMVMLGSQQAY
jgi:DNA-binding NarL/FixJ family response regulator